MNPTVNTFIALLRSRVCTTNQFTGAIDVQKTLKRRDPIVREDMVAIGRYKILHFVLFYLVII